MSADLRRVQRLSERADEVVRERDEAIRAAHKTGATMRVIAQAAGLTAGRVHQIIHAP